MSQSENNLLFLAWIGRDVKRKRTKLCFSSCFILVKEWRISPKVDLNWIEALYLGKTKSYSMEKQAQQSDIHYRGTIE